MEAGIEIRVPAGTFKGCARIREQDLIKLNEITDKVWCPDVGVVSDSSDGKLVISNALPAGNPASNVSTVGKASDKPLKQKSPVAKISAAEATKIALERMPGKATDVKIEKKLGKNVYVVEIQTSRGEKTFSSTSSPERSSVRNDMKRPPRRDSGAPRPIDRRGNGDRRNGTRNLSGSLPERVAS